MRFSHQLLCLVLVASLAVLSLAALPPRYRVTKPTPVPSQSDAAASAAPATGPRQQPQPVRHIKPRIQHIEPLSAFSLRHTGPRSNSPSSLDSNGFATASADDSNEGDAAAPYGDSIEVSFVAYGELFAYNMSLHSTAFTERSRVTLLSADGTETPTPAAPKARTYKTTFTDPATGGAGFALATVLPGGRTADVTVLRGGEVYHAQPLSTLTGLSSHADIAPETLAAVRTQSLDNGGEGLAVYRVSDIAATDATGAQYEVCGAANPNPTPTETDSETTETNAAHGHSATKKAVAQRAGAHSHSAAATTESASTDSETETEPEPEPVTAPGVPFATLSSNPNSNGNGARSLLSLSRWTGCFPGGPRRLHTGFALDYGSFVSLGMDATRAEAHVAAIVAQVNAVYEAQLGITVTVDEVLLMTSPGNGGNAASYLDWNHYGRNEGRMGCPAITPRSPQTLLDQFTRWRATQRAGKQGVWHLLSSCFAPPGTVGLAFMGATCLSGQSTGWSHLSNTAWLTVAHEIGHSLGASHPANRGTGSGLMGYADGKLASGEYGFNEQYTRRDICAHITASLGSGNVIFAGNTRIEPTSTCWSSYAPRCGDGVVEGDEECDSGSATGNRCCTAQCKLAPGATCANDGTDCCHDCQAQPATVACNNNGSSDSTGSSMAGYCAARGECRVSECAGFSNTRFCNGFAADNSCEEFCAFDDDPDNPNLCQRVTSADMSIAGGSYCALSSSSRSTNANSANTANTANGGAASTVGKCIRPSVEAPAVCVPVVRSWRAGAWGACSCAGIQTRPVACVEQDGVAVSATLCDAATTAGSTAGAKPEEEKACTAPAAPAC